MKRRKVIVISSAISQKDKAGSPATIGFAKSKNKRDGLDESCCLWDYFHFCRPDILCPESNYEILHERG